MHTSDTNHPNARLQQKLQKLFAMRQGSKVNWDLDGYRALLARLGNDHHRLPPVIHVAGTNGKGSIVAILRAILEAQGYRVHAYTSPHLIRANERIYLAGAEINDAYLETLIDEVLSVVEGEPHSFFEIITAIAFRAFAQTPADVLLLEVGCGGRLDCTNVIESPLVTVISRISMDHKEYLGDTLAKIAAEKAGIMKKGVPCVIGYQGEGEVRAEILASFKNAAERYAAKPLYFGEDWSCVRDGQHIVFSDESQNKILPLPNLLGDHQIWNAGAAIAALQAAQKTLPVSWESVAKGLQNITWAGRMQKLESPAFGLSEHYEIWIDAGHNDSAGEVLAEQIKFWQKQNPQRPIHVIVGMLGRKDMDAFLNPFIDHVQSVTIVPVPGEVSADCHDPRVLHETSYRDALKKIADQTPSARILITGSMYLAGDVLKSVGWRKA